MKEITLFSLAVAVMVPACSTSPSQIYLSVENPNQFMFHIEDGSIYGNFNPSGFETGEVEFRLAQECVGKKLKNYYEEGDLESIGSGRPEAILRYFNTTCEGGVAHTGSVLVTKMVDGSVTSQRTLSN